MEKVKYHQYGTGYDYGADGTLTDNWNPNLDYGNEYVSVYFNISTPSYGSHGFSTAEDRSAWDAEASRLIQSFGILEDSGWFVDHDKNKRAHLYAHPQQISGVIRKNDVRPVAEAIVNMKLSSLRWVDLHETVFVITDEEYREYLEGKKEEIRKLLFQKSATTRTNKYYSAFDVARVIAGAVRLHRLGMNDGKNYGGGQTIDYILEVADQMIEEGLLKCLMYNGAKHIRSLNKTEQKKLSAPARALIQSMQTV